MDSSEGDGNGTAGLLSSLGSCLVDNVCVEGREITLMICRAVWGDEQRGGERHKELKFYTYGGVWWSMAEYGRVW